MVGGEDSLLNSTHVETQVKGLFGFALRNIQKSFVIFLFNCDVCCWIDGRACSESRSRI